MKPEPDLRSPSSPAPPVPRPWLALAALLVLAYLPPVLLRGPWHVDEVRYVEVARAMQHSGDWLVTHLNGEVYSEKPPLFFWLVGAASPLLGAPLAGQLLAALSVAATCLIGVRLGRLLSEGDARVAWLAGAAPATCAMFLDRGQSALIDTLLLPLVSLSTLGLLEAARARGARAWAWSAVACLAAALACLTKGPVGVLFPLLGALLAGPLVWGRGGLHPPALVAVPLIGGGAVVLWVYLVARVVGWWFWERMIGQTAKRTGGGTVHHGEPIWFYLLDVPPKLLPWGLLLPGAVAAAWKGPPAPWRAAARALLAWALAGLLVFSLIGGKRPGYVLPLYLPLAILGALGAVVAEDAPGAPGRAWLTWPLRAVPFALLALGGLAVLAPAVGGLALAFSPAAAAALRGLPLVAWPAAPLLGLGALWLGRDALRAARAGAWVRVACDLAGGVALAAGLQGLTLVPLMDRVESTRELAAQVSTRVPDGARLVLLAGHHDGRLQLWTGVDHYDVVQVDELGAEADRPGQLWVLGRADPFQLVPPAVQARFEEQLRWPEGKQKNPFVLFSER